ncbi:MAG: MFS transporter [Verrucomicrobia bacterium]|nr:MFS transporter [Kiritimatiellia bacterium]MCP5487019.1 MFS transporter [Verrucomicrobiota bacterium]
MKSMLPRSFQRIWFGQTISRLGSGISLFALGVHLHNEGGGATACSLLLLCAYLPGLALAPLGGSMADRYVRRNLVAAGDAFCGLVIISVAALLSIQPESAWPIFTGMILISIADAFQTPARKALMSDLVEPIHYHLVAGRLQIAEAARLLVGPAGGALLLHVSGMHAVLWVDALTYGIAFAAALSIAAGQAPKMAQQNQGDVFRLIRRHSLVWAMLGLSALITLGIGTLQALLTPLVLATSTTGTLAGLQTAGAVGMLATSIWLGSRAHGNARRRLRAGLLAAGLCCMAMGSQGGVILLGIATVGLFMSLPFLNTSLDVIIRHAMPSAQQGRLWALVGLVSQSGLLIAFALAGPLADHLGVNYVVIAAGSLLALLPLMPILRDPVMLCQPGPQSQQPA